MFAARKMTGDWPTHPTKANDCDPHAGIPGLP
jgi:hypothetical protein